MKAFFTLLTHQNPRKAGNGDSKGKHEEEDENDHRPGYQLVINLQVCMPLQRRIVNYLVFYLRRVILSHLSVMRLPMSAIAIAVAIAIVIVIAIAVAIAIVIVFFRVFLR